MHHGAEDRQLFPELRETNPALNPVIDRLEGDRRRVSDDSMPVRRPQGT